ncbi:MAG: hypothetical protein ACXVPD_10155 [Bacteroidia bacterium]
MSVLFKTALLAFLTGPALKASNPDSLAALPAIRGIEKYKVRLICSNGVVDSLTVEKNRPFCFFLRRNAQYVLAISCEGHAPRVMQVNTASAGRRPNQSYFKFMVNAKLPGIHESDQPVPSIAFDEQLGGFYYED